MEPRSPPTACILNDVSPMENGLITVDEILRDCIACRNQYQRASGLDIL
jgi:hypothetical protein